MARVLGLAVVLTFLGSCSESHSCTEIGCTDAARVTIQTGSGEWAAGEYALQIVFDGLAHSCSFTMPEDLPAGVGQSGEFECEPSLSASFIPRMKCTEHVEGGTSSQTCTPIPNQFDLEISTQGTPAALSVELKLDGTVLANETQALEYQQSRPNGPDCEPVCNQASVEIHIP